MAAEPRDSNIHVRVPRRLRNDVAARAAELGIRQSDLVVGVLRQECYGEDFAPGRAAERIDQLEQRVAALEGMYAEATAS